MCNILGSCMNCACVELNQSRIAKALRMHLDGLGPTLAPWWNSSRTCSGLLLLYLPGLETLERLWKLSWHQIHSPQKMDCHMLSKLNWTRLTTFSREFEYNPKTQSLIIQYSKYPGHNTTLFKISTTLKAKNNQQMAIHDDDTGITKQRL